MPTISWKTGLMSLKRKASSFILLIYSFSTHKALNENKKSLHLKWNLTKCHLHVVTLINTSLFVFHFFPSTNHMWSGKKKGEKRKGTEEHNYQMLSDRKEKGKGKHSPTPPRTTTTTKMFSHQYSRFVGVEWGGRVHCLEVQTSCRRGLEELTGHEREASAARVNCR